MNIMLRFTLKDRSDKYLGGTVWYQYDESGQRTRKVWENGGITKMRIYIGEYEVWREYDAGSTLEHERQTIHISGEEKRFVLVETQTVENYIDLIPPNVNTRYQYGNQLNSACLELNEIADLLTYEEYHPFGTSSIRMGNSQAEVSMKRYRYNGKERDEETGLYYYGARYYADWLGRFLSVDPLANESPDMNPYHYVRNNPVGLVDPSGMQEEETEEHEIFSNHNGNVFRVDLGDTRSDDPNLYLEIYLEIDNLPEYFKEQGIENVLDLYNYIARQQNKPEIQSGDIGQQDVYHGNKKIRMRSRYTVLFDLIPELIKLGKEIFSGEKQDAINKLKSDAHTFRLYFNALIAASNVEGLMPDIFKNDKRFFSDVLNYMLSGEVLTNSFYSERYGDPYNEIVKIIGDEVVMNRISLVSDKYSPRETFEVIHNDYSHFDNAEAFGLQPIQIVSFGPTLHFMLAPHLEKIINIPIPQEPRHRLNPSKR